MTNSLSFPQEIIDSIVETIDDKVSLESCASTSRSFLYPSRKRLFSSISLHSSAESRNFYDILSRNPYIQSFVKTLWIYDHGTESRCMCDNEDLLSILQLPLRCLETFAVSYSVMIALDWNTLSADMKAAFWDIVHSSSLTSFILRHAMDVPLDIFLGLTSVRALDLNCVDLDIFDNKHWDPTSQVTSLSENTASPTDRSLAVERISWSLPLRRYSTRFPFMSYPRFVDFNVPYLFTLTQFDFFLLALGSSLQSPATLEHLTLKCGITLPYVYAFVQALRALDEWTLLDNVIASSTGSQLHRVDVNIILRVPNVTESMLYGEPIAMHQVKALLFQKLPQLSAKGILSVEVLLAQL
ncbi:hypothetical protein L208DRAFT_1299292 [Tricholoma matsutake]|nr:hypothetical protein L208DRAFT_1299292 [Tricholoma matsutake 945]